MWKMIAISVGLVMAGFGGSRAMDQTVDGKHASDVFVDPPVAQLARAACADNVAKVNELISQGVSPNARGANGMTLLFWALDCGKPETVEALLKAGADPNLAIGTAETPLYRAASYKDPAYLRLMLKYGGDPNMPMADGDTVLRVAFMAGKYGSQWQNYYMLLDAGVDVNLPEGGAGGIGIADSAAVSGFPSKAVELLERGYSYDLYSLALSIYGSGMNTVTTEQPEPLRNEPEYKYIGIAARMLKERGVDTEKVKRQIDDNDKEVGAGLKQDYSFENDNPE